MISLKSIFTEKSKISAIKRNGDDCHGTKNEKVPGIKESYRLLTFEYAFRQVGFIVLLAIIVAAIAGLFSSGVVSDVEKTNDAKPGPEL